MVNRRGVALAVALYALVVVAALVGAVFLGATTEQRIAEATRDIYQTFGVAEAGASEVLRSWNPLSFNALQVYPGDSLIVEPGRALSGAGSFRGVIRRLGANLYLVDITGSSPGGVASRVGLLARMPPGPPKRQDCDTASATSAKCHIYSALQGAGGLAPLRSRAWSRLF